MHSDPSCPRCGATSAHLRTRGFVVCAHCGATVHDGQAMAQGGAIAIRRAYRAMHSPGAADADSQEAAADMLEADRAGDRSAWRDAMRRWLTLMPITMPAYVPPEADRDQEAFDAWVEESVDSAALSKTSPEVAAAQAALAQLTTLAPDDLIGSARRYYAACQEHARILIAQTLREHPNARWLHSRTEREVARGTFRMGVRGQRLMLPSGTIPRIFQEVLGDRALDGDADCTSCGGPRAHEHDSACPWCGAIRVSEPGDANPMIRAQLDALIQQGQDDLHLASAALQLLIAPVWHGHALGSGAEARERLEVLVPWVERNVLDQAIGLMRHMDNPRVSPWLERLRLALSGWTAAGSRPTPRPKETERSMTLEQAWEDPWVRKAVAEFRMMGPQAQPVMVAVSMTRMPAMLGADIAPAQAAAYLMRVLDVDSLSEIPSAYNLYRPAFPNETAFYDAVLKLIGSARPWSPITGYPWIMA